MSKVETLRKKSRPASRTAFELVMERAKFLGIPPSEMGDAMGVGRTQYHNFKSGLCQPNVDQLVDACRAVSVEMIMVDADRAADSEGTIIINKGGSFSPVFLCQGEK